METLSWIWSHDSSCNFSLLCVVVCVQIKARVIHVNPTTKAIGLSAQEHIVENKGASFSDLRLGAIVESATVKHMESQLGAVVEADDSGLFGFVHVRLL